MEGRLGRVSGTVEDSVEKEDKLEEVDDFAFVLIGNAYVPLCPVCYNMIIGNPRSLYNKNQKFAQELHDENKQFTEAHIEKK